MAARFLLPPTEWRENAVLEGDEARHLSQVLRIRAGETVIVFDGEGSRADAEVLSVSRDKVSLKVGEKRETAAPLPEITLAQAIPKGKNMDLIVQKSVELGTRAIHPLVTRYTVVQPGDQKASKWRRVALEACKQCGQDTLVQIEEPADFSKWLSHQSSFEGLKIIASLAPGARPLREVLKEQPGTQKVMALIGPEGDFSSQETIDALEAGFVPVTLGDIVLRVETASLFVVSALRYELG